MPTFGDSWTITKTSFRILREDPALLALPAIAGAALFGILLVFTVPLVLAFLANPAAVGSFAGSPSGEVLLVAAYIALYFILVFVGNFFFAALVGAAMMKLEGGQPTVGQGIRFARQRVGRILVWSLIAASVGLIIRAISSRFRGLGSVIGLVAGVTWSVATYFAIPVIVFETTGPWASLKRSGSLFVHTFGETLVTNLIVALLIAGLFVAGFVPMAVGVYYAVGGAVALGATLILIAVAVWIFAAILASALEGILRAALYRYATTGKTVPGVVPQQYRVGIAGRF